jgi:hypothetical protein
MVLIGVEYEGDPEFGVHRDSPFQCRGQPGQAFEALGDYPVEFRDLILNGCVLFDIEHTDGPVLVYQKVNIDDIVHVLIEYKFKVVQRGGKVKQQVLFKAIPLGLLGI